MKNIRWRHRHQHDLQQRSWDAEEYIVFNNGSAQTHYLNQFAVDILELLQPQSLELSVLADQLVKLYENLELDAEITTYLQQTIQLLDEIGLIDPERL